MHIINTTALISINETAIVQLISFLIFLFLMHRIMFRPLRRVMGEREAYIEKVKKDIEDANAAFDQLTIEFERQRASVRLEAYAITRKMEDVGSREAGDIFNDTRGEIAEIRARADAEIEAQVEAAKQYASREVDTLAEYIMAKVLRWRAA